MVEFSSVCVCVFGGCLHMFTFEKERAQEIDNKTNIWENANRPAV